MAFSLTGVDLYYLIKEWKLNKDWNIINSRIDKIYQEGNTLSVKIHMLSKGNAFLTYHSPSLIYLTNNKVIENAALPHFAEFLRKKISGGFIRDVKQLSKRERIVEMHIEKKDAKYILIFELVSPGNVILCNSDYNILMPLKPKKFSNRTIRANVKYEINYRPDLTKEDFENIIKNTEKNAVKTFAIDCGLSGIYAEYLCKIANIDKDSKEIPPESYSYYLKVFEQEIEPCIGKRPHPFPVGECEKTDKSFNELVSMQKEKKEETKSREVKKIEMIIEQQKKTIEQLKNNDDEKKGELIYEHYQEIKNMLDDAKILPENELKSKYPFVKKKEGKKVIVEF